MHKPLAFPVYCLTSQNSKMKQFDFQNNILHLKVKKAPLLIRIIFFTIAFTFFIIPLVSLGFIIMTGEGFKFGHSVGIGSFFLGGFYLLRISLWNTYGEEKIEFLENKIIYQANYGWFKHGKREITLSAPYRYFIKSIGYEEDNIGLLAIASEKSTIESVVKMPIPELKELIQLLEKVIKK